MAVKILAFAGSARKESFNFRLVKVAAEGARNAGAEVTVLDMNDFNLPIFNEDLESEGRPADVQKLKDLFHAHDGLLIASPEYNSSVTPLLKNVIDWVSRPDDGKPPLSAFQGKIAGLMSASPGGLGGLRGLVHVRAILGNIGVTVIPKQMAVSRAGDAFDGDGSLKDKQQQSVILDIGQQVAEMASKLKS